jgi:hypothetical protein
VWVCWKGIFKSKIQKKTQQQFFSIFFLSWFEMELLKKQSFLKSKKITNEQQLYDVCSVQIVSGACLNFFLLFFKDGPLEKFDRFWASNVCWDLEWFPLTVLHSSLCWIDRQMFLRLIDYSISILLQFVIDFYNPACKVLHYFSSPVNHIITFPYFLKS